MVPDPEKKSRIVEVWLSETMKRSGALFLPDQGQLTELARLVAILAGAGDASPMTLITLGLCLIGLRDRIERGFRGDA